MTPTSAPVGSSVSFKIIIVPILVSVALVSILVPPLALASVGSAAPSPGVSSKVPTLPPTIAVSPEISIIVVISIISYKICGTFFILFLAFFFFFYFIHFFFLIFLFFFFLFYFFFFFLFFPEAALGSLSPLGSCTSYIRWVPHLLYFGLSESRSCPHQLLYRVPPSHCSSPLFLHFLPLIYSRSYY